MKKTINNLLLMVPILGLSISTHAQMRGSSNHEFISAAKREISNQINHKSPQSNKLDIQNYLLKGGCPDTLFFEDFQSQTIPAAWGNFDLDGNADANGRPQDWYVSMDAQNTVPGDTNWVATSSSWFTPFAQASNWLTTGPVTICNPDIDLYWKSAPFEGPGYMDGYKIYISTTGNSPADFVAAPIFTMAEDIAGGAGTPGPGVVHTLFNGNNGVLDEYSVDLSPYLGQTIYIGFYHDSNDDNLIMLDDIWAGSLPNYDLILSGAQMGSEYTITPIDQVQPMQFSAVLDLLVGMDVTDPTVGIDVWDGAASVFSASPTQATQTAGSSITYSAPTTYTPSVIGNYEVRYNGFSNEVDPNINNNRDTAFFVVSDSVYARDNGVYDGSLGIGAGSPGFLGNQFELFVADDLTSITFILDAPTIGDTVVAHVYDMIAGQPNAIVGSTDTLFITSASTATYTLPIIGGSINLSSGTYVVGIQESVSNNITLSTSTQNFIPQRAWVFFNGAWDFAETFGFNIVYAVRANFGPVCSPLLVDYTGVIDYLDVDFTDISTTNGSPNYLWDFGDGNTSTMQNPSHTYAADGTYTVCLTISDDCGTDSTCHNVTVAACNSTIDFSSSDSALVVDFSDISTTNGSPSYLWDFGDGNTSTMQNPTHTYTADGSYTVCLTVTDDCGTDSTCHNVNVTSSSVGINDTDNLGLAIYPNPTLNDLIVESNVNSGSIVIRDAQGRMVKRTEIVSNTTVISMVNLANGVYFVELNSNTCKQTKRVIKK